MRRYLYPGTGHFEISIETTLLAAGHFHSKDFLSRSLTSMLVEHYCGNATADTLAEAGTTFHRMAYQYSQIILRDDFREGSENDSLPTDENLAALVILVYYMDQLTPYKSMVAGTGIQSTVEFYEDRAFAFEMIKRAIRKKCEFATSSLPGRLREAHEELRGREDALRKHYRGGTSRDWADIFFVSLLATTDFEAVTHFSDMPLRT